MARKIHILLALISLAATAGAQQPPNATTDSGSAPLRDPFWPIGYFPKPKTTVTNSVVTKTVAPVVVRQDDVEWPKLALSGIVKGQENYLAVLEGIGVVETGDIVAVRRAGRLFRWTIDEVSEEGVKFSKLDVTAPPGR